MHIDAFVLDLTVVLVGAAVLSWIAFVLRQPIILGYLVCGAVVGPWGFDLLHGELEGQDSFVDGIGRIGVALLLFLAGTSLHPNKLVTLFRQSAVVTFGTCVASVIVCYGFARVWGMSSQDSLWIGLALMFSSTILVVKLLPTTTLHQQHMGAVCISILIVQDIIAVLVLMFLAQSEVAWTTLVFRLPLMGALILAAAFAAEQWVLRPMMAKADRIHETLYLLAIAWCLGIATLAETLGFSFEMGAFVAGLALARSPLARFLAEGLKPFRDFFLVLFFFVLGARLDLLMARHVIGAALLLGGILLVIKPVCFYLLLHRGGEAKRLAKQTGVRMGQASEFSLVIATFALAQNVMSEAASNLVQLTAILTMTASSYVVAHWYPTPVAPTPRMQRD